MSKRNIGTEILSGINEIEEYKKGKHQLKTTHLTESSLPEVIRSKLQLSQSALAGLLGVSTRTL